MEAPEEEKLTKLFVNNFLIKNKNAAIKGKKFVIDRLVHNVKKLQQRANKVGEGGGDAAAFQRKEKRITEEIQISKALRPENILKFGILNKKTFQKVSSTPDANVKEVALCRLVENPSIKKVIDEFRGSFPNYEEKVKVMFQTMGLQKIKHRKQRMSKIQRMGSLDQYLANERQNVEILEELLGIDVNSGILKRRSSSAFKTFQEERGGGRKMEEERGGGGGGTGGGGGKMTKERSSRDSFVITSIFENAGEDDSGDFGSDGYESGSDGDDDDMDDECESDDKNSEFESEENEKDLKDFLVENRTKNKGDDDLLNSKGKNIQSGKKIDSLDNNSFGNSLSKGNAAKKDRESNSAIKNIQNGKKIDSLDNNSIEKSLNKVGNETKQVKGGNAAINNTPQKRKLSQTPEVLESNSTQKKQKLDGNKSQPSQNPKEKAKQKDGKGDTKNKSKKKKKQKKKQPQNGIKAAPTEEVRVLKLSEADEGTIGPLKAQKVDSDSEIEEDFFIRDPSKVKKKEEEEEESGEGEQEDDFIDIDTSIYFRRNLYRGGGVEDVDDGLVSDRGRGSRGRGGRGRGGFHESQGTRDDNFSRQRGRGRGDVRGGGRGGRGDGRGRGRGGRGDDRGRSIGDDQGRGRGNDRGRGRGGRGDDRGRGRGDDRGRGRGGKGDDRGRGRGRGDGPKGPGDGPLHPSWEAKIKQNTQHLNQFQGKKIVFD